MDSLDFFRRCIWPINDREEADARLDAVLAWCATNVQPERIYGREQLQAWAARNGYTTTVDTQELCALLRRLKPLTEAPGELNSAIVDMLHKYREV
jgi:hypothetical protein